LPRRYLTTIVLVLVLAAALMGQPSAFSSTKSLAAYALHAAQKGDAPTATTSVFATEGAAGSNDAEVTTTTSPITTTTIPTTTSTTTASTTSTSSTTTSSTTTTQPAVTTTTVPATTTTTLLPPVSDPGLGVTTTSSPLVTQVGGKIHYTTRVTNDGQTKLKGVTVLALLQPELSAQTVSLVDAVDAALIGSYAQGDDVVWVLKDLAPGQSVDLPWTAKAMKPGDLRAVTTTTAKTKGVKAKADPATTYLATAAARAVVNPVPVVKKKIVTYHSKVVPQERPPLGSAATGSVAPAGSSGDELPFTGSDPTPVILWGFLLILMGLVLVFAPKSFDRRKMLALMLVVLTACVASNSNHSAAPGTTVPDRVKGKLIRKGDGGGTDTNKHAGDGGSADGGPVTTTTLPFQPPTDTAASAPTTTLAGPIAAGQEGPLPTVTTIVRHVEQVVVPVQGLAVDKLQSRAGDDLVALDWSEVSGIETATSSAMFNSGSPVEILTSLGEGNGSVEVDVTLRNLEPRTRLQVKGHLEHIISGASGTVATLRSEPLDLVLNPNGVAQAHFTYLLPTGSYTMSSSFVAD
jgi:hypothetical protein